MTNQQLLAWTLILFGISVFWLPPGPKLMNCCIMVIYAITAIWWATENSWADVFYWIFAGGLTAIVTFGYDRA
jgi:hypothetical protein